MVIWFKFCSSTSFSFLFFYFFIIIFFLFFCTFIWLQGDLRGNWIKVIFYFYLILAYFLFYQLKITIFLNYYTLSNSFYFSVVVAIPFICYYQFFFFLMEHIFYKIILNIYFDHKHIIRLYRIFSVFYTGYMLVIHDGYTHPLWPL